MSVLMKGADVANAMKEELIEKTNHLKEAYEFGKNIS